MEHLFPGETNTIHTITEDQLHTLFLDNQREAEESADITASSYRGENYYTQFEDQNYAFDLEYLLRDPKTSGMRMYYPHGIVIEQSARRNFYRGENQIYPSSIPSLLRAIRKYKTREEKELYRLVSDMRIMVSALYYYGLFDQHSGAKGETIYKLSTFGKALKMNCLNFDRELHGVARITGYDNLEPICIQEPMSDEDLDKIIGKSTVEDNVLNLAR